MTLLISHNTQKDHACMSVLIWPQKSNLELEPTKKSVFILGFLSVRILHEVSMRT